MLQLIISHLFFFVCVCFPGKWNIVVCFRIRLELEAANASHFIITEVLPLMIVLLSISYHNSGCYWQWEPRFNTT